MSLNDIEAEDSITESNSENKEKFEPDFESVQKISEMLEDKFRFMKEYYYKASVKFQLIKYCQNREFAFLVPKWIKDFKVKGISNVSSRNWRVHNVQSFDAILNRKIFHNGNLPKIIQLYVSCAKYENGIPMQELNSFKRDNEDWKINHWKSMIGFDFMADFDARPFKHIYNAWRDARTLKRIYDRHEVPYSLRYSGSGFHITVPGSAMPKLSFDPLEENSIYQWQNSLLELMSNKISGMIDTTTWDSRQLQKIPFSLAFLDNEEIYISTEFNNKESFTKFFTEDFDAVKNKNFADNLGRIEPFVFNAKNINNPNPIIKLKRYLEAKK